MYSEGHLSYKYTMPAGTNSLNIKAGFAYRNHCVRKRLKCQDYKCATQIGTFVLKLTAI
jgi:hypothetical protein